MHIDNVIFLSLSKFAYTKFYESPATLCTNQPLSVYHLDEDTVLGIARRCLCGDELPGYMIRNPENPSRNLFLARLHGFSDHTRLISPAARPTI